MNEQAAKELVIRAGKELVSCGLIARTWGNVSCRVDDKTFAITPSGRQYETLTPEDIVLCKIEDCSYEGNIKPSSEKGIHALVYKMYNEKANFVIHTHQRMASVISASGLKTLPVGGFPLLGESIPIADYGLPGTKALRKGVENALRSSESHGVIMAHHGALCYGADYDETFQAAQQLEEACLAGIRQAYTAISKKAFEELGPHQYYLEQHGASAKPAKASGRLFCSRRTSDGFILKGEQETTYRFTDTNLPKEAAVHSAVYQNRSDIHFIQQDLEESLLTAADAKAPLVPLLDDFAQIVGLTARCAKSAEPGNVVKALRGRLGVLIPGYGALCCASTLSDVQAVRLVMEKDAAAQIGTQLYGGGKALGLPDCILMHAVYTKSYSKRAKEQGGS